MPGFKLEKSIPVAGGVPTLMGLGMVVKGASLVGFGLVRGDNFMTSTTDMFFSVSDHEVLLSLSYIRILNTPFKSVNPSEIVFPL
jgi:hypothetical protein